MVTPDHGSFFNDVRHVKCVDDIFNNLMDLFDRGTKFMAEFAKMYQNKYGLKRKPITTRNPHSNAIIKQIHQIIEKIIRTFDVSNILTKIHGKAS